MSANIIKYDGYCMSYPVGLRLKDNLPIIQQMAQEINKLHPEGTIALWCRGSSGLIIGGIIASLLPNRLITINHMKKQGEKSHNDNRINLMCMHNIIVDDFVATGSTVNTMLMEIRIMGIEHVDLCISGNMNEDMLEKFDNIILSGSIW